MKIVVTTPTGNIGSKVASHLLDAGEEVILVARDPAKVKALTSRGARVETGSHADPRFLTQVTQGVDALFLLTPPDFATTDIRQSYRRFGEAAKSAILANHIPMVVHLSSAGAELESGTGPIAGLFVNEALLSTVATNLVHLRAGYFMENTLGQLASIRDAGALFTTFKGTTPIPMVATRDIAARAAELLRAGDVTGTRVVEFQGPGPVTYDEVARILSEVLNRPLRHVTVGKTELVSACTGMGMSTVMAESFYELGVALESGLVKFHGPRSDADQKGTSYATFAREVAKPAYEAAQG